MTDAVIVSTARTALAKSWRGSFNMTHGATLGGHVVQHARAAPGDIVLPPFRGGSALVIEGVVKLRR